LFHILQHMVCAQLQPYHHPVPLSFNLRTLTSWNPLGHSRTVTGLLSIYTHNYETEFVSNYVHIVGRVAQSV
jgi:hypothetical protein